MSETWPAETIPVLRVTDAEASAAWYGRLGFTVEWVHRFGDRYPAFVSLVRDGTGTRIFLSEHEGDAPGPALVWLRVTDIEPVAKAFGVHPEDQGARREVRLVDPDGNRLTVGALGDRRDHPAHEYTEGF